MVNARREEQVEQTEDQLVAAIRRVLSGAAPGVVISVGDDAAVVEGTRHQQVLTTDLLVEGVHFELESISPHDLGYKSVVVNVSDVAAMGGVPRYGLASLGVPEGVEAPWVMELYGGMREGADEHAMALVGGDTSRSDRVVVSVTVSGEVASGAAVTRGGARPGDRLVVTGRLGAAAGGLKLAQAEPDAVMEILGSDWARQLVRALERPVARVGEGQALAAAGATAMMDLSDGLSLDLQRMCRESGVGAVVRAADVPVAEGLERLAGTLGGDPRDLALHGGEDYELLAALSPDSVERARDTIGERFGTELTEIGEVTERQVLLDAPESGVTSFEPRGWDHFASE
jgi:thiamine-monophosphate kinase